MNNMYEKIYNYIAHIDLVERESVHENARKFINDFENCENSGKHYYKETRKQLENLVNDFKRMEDLEEMENFLWHKIYVEKASDQNE